ncbi:MAG: hypothetical protein HYZ68_01120 [Chloroflexi bacterium]|nr:hypothetical protein [Chloroflexota bacterium]
MSSSVITEGRTDDGLLGLARDLDPEALSQIYQRNVGSIFRYLHLRVGRREVAEDLAADVFLKALEGIAAYQDGAARRSPSPRRCLPPMGIRWLRRRQAGRRSRCAGPSGA